MANFSPMSLRRIEVDMCKGFNDYLKVGCARGVTQAQKDYSLAHFGKILCWNCQKKELSVHKKGE